MLNETYGILSTAQQPLNICGGIPLLGIISGTLRILIGKIEFIVGACLGVAGLAGAIFGKDKPHWDATLKGGAELMVHGQIDIVNGIAETIFATTPFSLIIFTIRLCNNFQPMIPYGTIFENASRQSSFNRSSIKS